jgi:hypothetical protein
MDGGNISGSTTTNLSLSTTSTNDGGSYSVFIENAFGSVTSSLVKLTLILGQPSLGQNLLVNGDFSAGNTGFTTGYSFVSSGISQYPGTYGIRANSQSFNSAYNSFGDHTTGNGLMMLVDGCSSGTTVWSETVNVSPNVNYQFSGWAISSDAPNPAMLQLLVNGSPVGTIFDLPATSTWTNFSAAWNSSANISATLAIVDVNPNPYAAGDDFALDDLAMQGLQPVNIRPTFLTKSMTGGNFQFSWNAVNTYPAVGYQVQYTTNLVATNWINLGWVLTGSGTTVSSTDTVSTNRQRFYRVLLVQ